MTSAALRPVLLLVSLGLLAAGCQPDCPDGTAESDGTCAASDDDDDLTAAPDDDDATAPDDDDSGGDDDDATGDDDDDSTDPPVGPIAVPAPPAPSYPPTAGVVSITLVTADVAYAGTDANQLSMCLTATDCFTLNVGDVNDQERGQTDVYHYEGVGLDRADIDRVEIRSVNGTDRYEPSCLAVQLDGEPVHCAPLTGLYFGEENDELGSWIDPQGLHAGCVACSPSVLTHGPMIGALEPDGARFWARTDATRLVGLRVSTTADLTDAPVVDWAWPSPIDDYAATLEVANLAPDTEYWYGLEVDGALVSESRSFTTAPAPGASGLTRFAFGSCSKFDDQPIFDLIAAEEPDLFLFVGDNHYGNTGLTDALRWWYRWGMARPERAALLATTSTLATWDDHDYTGNNTDATAPGRQNALRVFGEYWANPAAGDGITPGVFFSHGHGDVDFILLDDRYHRGLDDSILGGPQQQWLLDTLAASTATFKLVVTGSQWTADGSGDSWASFVTQRDVILDHIRDMRIDGVVLLSGDVHRSEFRVIERGSVGGYDLPELTSSPLANLPSSCPNEAEILTCYDDSSNFVVVDVDTLAADPTLVARMVDDTGALIGTFSTSLSALTVP